eukprot:1666706-Pleurochrysis_carterae.AAC.1
MAMQRASSAARMVACSRPTRARKQWASEIKRLRTEVRKAQRESRSAVGEAERRDVVAEELRAQ